MLRKSRVKKRHNRLIALMFSGIILLTVYFIAYSYFVTINKSKTAILDKLMGIAFTSSRMIDGDLHDSLSQKFIGKDDIRKNDDHDLYYRLHSLLNDIQEINKLSSPIYTIVYDSISKSFQFIGTSSQHPYYRHNYEQFPSKLLEDYDLGGVLDTHKSENGTWLSSFAPIKNNEGKTVALIQIDERFGDFITSARNELMKNIVLALIIILPFTFLLLAHVKSTLDKEEKHKEMLADKNEEIKTQNEFIKENNNKLLAAKMIIEQKNLELNTKVEVRTAELVKSNEELKNFLYRSSHDIQGPITTLQGLCNLASSDLKGQESLAYIYMINDTTSKLLNTVKSINHVYEIKNKKIVTERVEIDPLIQKLGIQFNNKLQEKGIALYTDLEPHLIAHADRDILHMSLSELLKNGIEFNCRLNGEQPYIKVRGVKIENHVYLYIEDNGIGINPETQEIIFDMFKRGNEASEGVGLGLYAAKTGIKLINGNIKLAASSENCTRFEIRLPAA